MNLVRGFDVVLGIVYLKHQLIITLVSLSSHYLSHREGHDHDMVVPSGFGSSICRHLSQHWFPVRLSFRLTLCTVPVVTVQLLSPPLCSV